MMRIMIFPLFIMIFMLFCEKNPVESDRSKWQALNSGLPENTSVQSIALFSQNPDILYIGTYNGVYLSKDGANTWNFISHTLYANDISCLAIHPNNEKIVFVGSRGKGVFRTTDSGNKWESVWPKDFDPHIHCISFSATGTILWIGTDRGLYKSEDQGQNWTCVYPYSSILSVAPDAVDVLTIYTSVNFAGNFKSTDNGSSWFEINNGLFSQGGSTAAANRFTFHPYNPKTILMSTGWVDLYQTINGGVDWKQTGKISDLSAVAVAYDPVDANKVWVATEEHGVYKSQDGAVTFSKVDNIFSDIQINDLRLARYKNRTVVYVGTLSKGLYKYVD